MNTRALLLALLIPAAASAQLPLAALPDWIKPASRSAEVLTQTHVTLMANNYTVVKPNVIGRSKGFKLLGLITIVSASYTDAMSKLYKEAEVHAGHPLALANMVHESNSSYFILFSIPKVTIRADLIEFVGTDDYEEMDVPAPALLGL